MKLNSTSRVTIIAIAVEDYKYMPHLRGPITDVENFHSLLVKNPKTALYHENQFIQLFNPSSSQIRELISTYTNERSALGDVLVFYFSGHGTAVGHKDFGFCSIDTQFHSGVGAVLPLTVFRFSELLEALSIVDVAPVVIIDACYSGKAGDALVSPSTVTGAILEKIRAASASNYALLCSCSDLQTSLNDPRKGGLFSMGIFEISSNGIVIDNQAPYLIGLHQLFRPLTIFMEQNADDSTPRLYLGDTLLEFPLVKNIKYSPQSYAFVGHLKLIIDALWNKGKPKELRAREILDICGKGSYGNHSKLSLDPWQLVENSPESITKRRLTKKGTLFAEGKIKIPKSIEKDPITGKWVPSPGTTQIAINNI